jgi:filamentous hemagglutinin family protein
MKVTQPIISIGILVLATPAYAQITPSGQTATTVTTVGARPTVSIAPTLPGGLSYNSYNSFSVGTVGANLDNRSIGARTIVNEVITTNRSVISGPVEVLGSKAHVIIANPNGITVDGGSFINAGGVVLGAGTITLQGRTPAPYLTQTNAILNIGGADVFVASGGLGGTMASLQMYAGHIKIDGPVKVSPALSTLVPGDIQLLAGKSSVEFDSAVLPIAALGNWSAVTRKGSGSTEVLVDVTSNGSLEASRVIVGVTEQGAGVSYAGKGLASAGEFRIDGSGQVIVKGAQVTAAGDVKARGSSIQILNTPATQSKLISVAGALTLIATNGDLTNIGGLLQGEIRNASDTDSKGAATLKASGDILLKSETVDRLGVVFANADDLVVNAGGNITNTAGRFLSNKATTITAGGNYSNTVDIVGASVSQGIMATSSSSHGPWWAPWRRRSAYKLTIDHGTLALANQIPYTVGTSVTINAAHVTNRGGEIDANDGSVIINTATFANTGVVTGAATYQQNCGYTCSSSGSSTLANNGGRINASKLVTINATGAVSNVNGQWVGLDGVTVTAGSLAIAGTPIITISERPGGLNQWFRGTTAWMASQDMGGQILSPNGTITLNTTASVTVDGSEIVGRTVVAPAGITTLRPASTTSPLVDHKIGVLSDW